MSSAWKLWGDDPDTAASCDMESFTEPDDTTYVSLVNTFFDRRWTYLPVLHRPSFVSEHLTPFLARSPTKVTSNFLVNIVCAIAATDKAWAQQWDLQRHKQFFRRAIQDVYVLSSVEDFECMQCFLLLCMYGHNEPQSVNMWYTSGITLQMAIDLDLHRKESISGQSLLRAELSKRVFWSAYVTHCSMAINMGRPLAIQESDITVPLPLQLRDEQLTNSFDVPDVNDLAVPQLMDTSTFNHIIKLRLTNAAVYKTFHSIRCGPMGSVELDTTRQAYYLSLNQWLISAPRYIGAVSTYQSTEWFQIAFHHAVLSLYRPSRAAPMPSSDDLRICTESAIGLITSYSSLYARNRIKYTFVAIHSLFLAAVTMLYALRASQQLRQELTKPVVETNILTFLTLFRGISDGRTIGEKCSGIVERLANSLLTLFDVGPIPDADLDVEFQSWFGLQTHAVVTPARNEELAGEFPDVRVDLPWADLFTEGFDMGAADLWSYSFLE
ncbi:hypothetical protein N7452_011446 [Penicillium brevicompactum]|uniref:Xylanolytic transcriptional activator regulatory domain-containing protein n=1 Tax=Penicillium brevicompactum TaxID=5074 RepID=A0A9W9Q4E5_PENBR|nr:hypothetical protein N7452_011446 [Penicillium brevicompactum]